MQGIINGIIGIAVLFGVGVIGLSAYGFYSLYAASSREEQKKRDFWSSIRPEYLDSIKCKYCGHYDPYVCVCRWGSDYDKDIDGKKGYGGICSKRTPEDRCERFTTSGMDCFIYKPGEKRADGSYYVSIRDAKK